MEPIRGSFPKRIRRNPCMKRDVTRQELPSSPSPPWVEFGEWWGFGERLAVRLRESGVVRINKPWVGHPQQILKAKSIIHGDS